MKHTTLQGGDLTLRPLTEADIQPLCDLATAHADALRLLGTPPNTPDSDHPARSDVERDALFAHPRLMCSELQVGRKERVILAIRRAE